MFQPFSPWTKNCRLRCGLVKDVSCGKPHKIHSDPLFDEEDCRFWPNFGERQVQIVDIGKDLEKEIDNLSFQIDARGQFLMRQYCELILTSYVDKGNWIAMTTPHVIRVGNKVTTLSAGRSQAKCVNGVHTDLGTAVFKSASASILALSILMLHHLLAGHNKVKTRLSLLKHGWVFPNIGQTLKSLESKCARCRLNKAKCNNTTTNIHINSSGRSYNLGMLAEDPDGHTMSVDQMGPVYGENGKKFWAYIFFSHTTHQWSLQCSRMTSVH